MRTDTGTKHYTFKTGTGTDINKIMIPELNNGYRTGTETIMINQNWNNIIGYL